MEFSNIEEYQKHKKGLEELGEELGKHWFKVLSFPKYDEYDYTDMYLVFSKAVEVVNEKLFDEFMAEKGLIPKFGFPEIQENET